MIDHLSLNVRDYQRSLDFYRRALAPLGYEVVMEISRAEVPSLQTEATCGLGTGGKPDLWLQPTKAAFAPVHVAILASDRAAVDAFYQAAIAAGGRDHGAPGLRPHYHPNYYGAFVLDPDGHNLEAVCHAPA